MISAVAGPAEQCGLERQAQHRRMLSVQEMGDGVRLGHGLSTRGQGGPGDVV